MSGRRPAGRRPSRSRKRRQLRVGEALVLVVVILWVVGRLLYWLAGHLWIVPLTLLPVTAGAVLWQRTRIQQARQHQASARTLQGG
ncbi:hypothetical protein OHA79_03880 [Streptomyces sp. NBC_00841]|uniref:hypothetical protein n=1 Tax=Streptomyces sp. NBC_00841 TaxID=2975847 RepID=UPI002DDC6719|nr:hypothetical protein [Streptomyces sp. NBC_00841]WRZ97128.1 hypothetical protein OHA79_03880 [Streptomyces sp. NBC_00841]